MANPYARLPSFLPFRMADQVVFSQLYGTVLVDASVPCISTQWHAFANATEFIALQGFALEDFAAHSTPARP